MEENDNVVYLKSSMYPEQFNLRLRPHTKAEIKELKDVFRVDVSTHLRNMVEREIERLLGQMRTRQG